MGSGFGGGRVCECGGRGGRAVRAAGGMFIGFMLLVRMEGDKTPVDITDRPRLAREMARLILDGTRCR